MSPPGARALPPVPSELLGLHDRVHRLAGTFTRDWPRWLDVMGRLPHESLRNQLLLDDQLPGASQVLSARQWRDAHGRTVTPGERPLTVLRAVPAPDGSGRIVGHTTGLVYDVSQTTGRALPDRPVLVAGQAPAGLVEALTGVAGRVGVRVQFDGDPERWVPGSTRTVRVATGEDDRTLAVRLVGAVADRMVPAPHGLVSSFEAASVAVVVSRVYGLPPRDEVSRPDRGLVVTTEAYHRVLAGVRTLLELAPPSTPTGCPPVAEVGVPEPRLDLRPDIRLSNVVPPGWETVPDLGPSTSAVVGLEVA